MLGSAPCCPNLAPHGCRGREHAVCGIRCSTALGSVMELIPRPLLPAHEKAPVSVSYTHVGWRLGYHTHYSVNRVERTGLESVYSLSEHKLTQIHIEIN